MFLLERPLKIPPPPARRFPKYGTPEFSKQCPWVMTTSNHSQSCITYVTPKPKEYEGVAEWVNKIVIGYIDSRIRGCQFLLDYGQGVDIRRVLNPVSSDWTVPKDFSCRSSECFNYAKETRHNILTPKQWELGGMLRPSGVHIPSYRHAFKNLTRIYDLYRTQFRDLEKALPGFQLESGVACALGSVLELAPQAANFQSDLFRIILALRDESTLVMTLYLRTGKTDRVASAEKKGEPAHEETHFENMPEVQEAMQCAQKLERQYLLESGLYSRVAWLLVSDSVPLKKWVTTSYQGQTNNDQGGLFREIVTTTAKGIHTRASRDPSIADFAEAMIDWFLVGESDLLITSAPLFYSFGTTAALRTNLPQYDGTDCSKMVLVHDGLPPI
jgi:hypothetical protein